MAFLNRTCREIAIILVAREDRPLGLADKLALRLHMSICGACPKFERQILSMRNGFARWRNYAGDDNSPGEAGNHKE